MPRSVTRSMTRLAAATAVAGIVLIGGTGAASAHVTVNGPGATQGGYAVLTFRVPTESDTASTTGLTVQLPTDTPLAYVGIEAKPGWTYTAPKATLPTPVTTDDGQITEAVSQITWTAEAASAIKPGEFAEFTIQAGPMPAKDSITFKALQAYSDGTRVDWIETPAQGSTAEPEHPAPSLALAAATSQEATGAAGSAPAATGGLAVSGTAASADGHSAGSGAATTGIVLGAVGVVLGGTALGVVVLRGRRSARPAGPGA